MSDPASGDVGTRAAEPATEGAPGRVRTVRLALPPHLETLAGVRDEIRLEVEAPVTMTGILDALEARFPMLEGTIRVHRTSERRPMIRFWAGGRDLSHEPLDARLPDAVAEGAEVVHVVGALAGG